MVALVEKFQITKLPNYQTIVSFDRVIKSCTWQNKSIIYLLPLHINNLTEKLPGKWNIYIK